MFAFIPRRQWRQRCRRQLAGGSRAQQAATVCNPFLAAADVGLKRLQCKKSQAKARTEPEVSLAGSRTCLHPPPHRFLYSNSPHQ